MKPKIKTPPAGIDAHSMSPSEIAETVKALHKAIECISELEQDKRDLRKLVNNYRMHLGYHPINWREIDA